MGRFVNAWRSDKLKTTMTISWLMTVFFCFFGGAILQVEIPGFCTLYPFRVLLPLTTLLYLGWVVREKRNPWKGASFAQKTSYVLCLILLVYSTLSLRIAMDFEFTFSLWLTLGFDLVFFYLAMEFCADREIFDYTAKCALAGIVIQIALGFIEVFNGGIFSSKFDCIFSFWGRAYHSPSVAAGNPNDFSMVLIFTWAILLLHWIWRGHKEKGDWVPMTLIPLIYFLMGAAYARLCEISFWILLVVFALRLIVKRGSGLRVLIVAIASLAIVIGLLRFEPDNVQKILAPQETTVQTAAPAAAPEVKTLTPVIRGETQARREESDGIRVQLLLHAADCFVSSKGMGVGLGNTAQLAKIAAKTGEIWAIHCFIARMAADFGIWFLIPLLLIALNLLKIGIDAAISGIRRRNWIIAANGLLYAATVIIYPVTSTASGDAQNCLPMWLFLGCIVAFPAYLREIE